MAEKNLRILHVAETIRGGVATVMRQLMAAQRADTEVALCAAVVPAEQAQDLVGVPATALHSFPRSGRNLGSLLALVQATWRALQHTQPNIVHLHSTFAGVLIRPLLLLLPKAQRPWVVYCPHAWAFMMQGSGLKKRLYAFIERHLLPLTDAVICVSHYERELAAQFGLPTAKMVVIYNGVPQPTAPIHAKQLTPEKPLQALFVGRLDRQKGFDVLLAAMQQLPTTSVQLRVIGEAVHGTAAPPAMPNITYSGWQTPAQVSKAMQQADVLIMPSRWEGFAMVPLEAMANRCAVLASAVCSLPEVIEEGVTGRLVPPENVAALVEVLRITPRTAWHTMGQAAQKLVKEKFTLAATTQATQHLYQDLLKKA